MEQYRWGVLGVGNIAHEFTKGLKATPGAKLHSVHSRSAEKAKKFAATYGFKDSFNELELFLQDPELEIVYIATPNNLHAQHAIQCLEANKHVLVEKPFALNAAEAKQIQKTARQQNRFCMEAMWTRFMPLYQEVAALLHQNALGEVKYLEASFGYARAYDPEGREFNPKLGGGSLLDLGVYPISLALMLLGTPDRVEGFCHKAKSGVDSMSQVSFHYNNGAVARLHCSFEQELPNRVWIAGSNGSIDIHPPIFRPFQFRLNQYQPAVAAASFPGYGLQDKLHSNPLLSKTIHALRNLAISPLKDFRKISRVPYLSNGYQYEAAAVMESIAQGKQECDTMPLSESITVLEITDALLKEWEISHLG